MHSDEILLDNDFCNMFSNLNTPETKIDVNELYNKIISKIGKRPCIHKYIADSELLMNSFIREKIQKNEIRIIDFPEIIKNAETKIYYDILFHEYYKFLYEIDSQNNKIDLKTTESEFTGDVFTCRRAGVNLGEIHSLITSFFLGIPIFLSNDNGAKLLAEQKINTQKNINVKVISGFEFLLENESVLTKQERKAILSLHKTWKEKWKKLKSNPINSSISSSNRSM